MSSAGVSGYAAINSRVRILYAALLSPAILTQMADAPDLGAQVRLLQETLYRPYLSSVDEKSLNPRHVVYLVKGRLAYNYYTLLHLVPVHARLLLQQFYRRFEVDNLKAVLRGISSGSDWDRVRFVLFPLGSFTVLPAQEMVETGNVTAAVELLAHTPYYPTLAHAMERFTAEQNLFPLEVSLDLFYWRGLWQDLNRLPSQDRLPALHTIGSLVDLNNLMWAIRYRVYHHLSEEEVINYTLPFGYKVKDDDIRAIAAGADIIQVVSRLYPEITDVESILREPETGLPQLELQLQRHVAEECRKIFAGYPFHIGIPLAYLILNELEIQDMTVLFEARSAERPVENFQSYLLMGNPVSE